MTTEQNRPIITIDILDPNKMKNCIWFYYTLLSLGARNEDECVQDFLYSAKDTQDMCDAFHRGKQRTISNMISEALKYPVTTQHKSDEVMKYGLRIPIPDEVIKYAYENSPVIRRRNDTTV